MCACVCSHIETLQVCVRACDPGAGPDFANPMSVYVFGCVWLCVCVCVCVGDKRVCACVCCSLNFMFSSVTTGPFIETPPHPANVL